MISEKEIIKKVERIRGIFALLKPKYHEFQLGAERALIEKNSI